MDYGVRDFNILFYLFYLLKMENKGYKFDLGVEFFKKEKDLPYRAAVKCIEPEFIFGCESESDEFLSKMVVEQLRIEMARVMGKVTILKK